MTKKNEQNNQNTIADIEKMYARQEELRGKAIREKIDFAALIAVKNANPNSGLDGFPRTDINGYGEISDVCIKRKVRNRMQDTGSEIFVKSDDRCDDGYKSLNDRATGTGVIGAEKPEEECKADACDRWLDVRAFGQLFAFKQKKAANTEEDSSAKEGSGNVSLGIRGPVTIQLAKSASPVEVEEMQITKSVNGSTDSKMSSDRIGSKRFVRFGLYVMRGAVNVHLAQRTGFSDADAEVLKECLRTMFVNDASSARPEGSMEVVRLIWWKHSCEGGQYPSAQVQRSLEVRLKDGIETPSCVEDYDIVINDLPGLVPEIVDGV